MCPLEAYLITDERIARHAAKYAHGRPQLAVGGPDTPLTAPGSPQTAGDGPGDWVDVAPMGRKPRCGPRCCGPGWTVRHHRSDDRVRHGAAVGRMTRLREHARAGCAVQTTRGSRAVRPGDGRPPGHSGTGRPPRGPRRPRGDA